MPRDRDDPHEFLASLEVAPAPHVNDDLVAPGKRHCPICGFLMESRLQAGLNVDVCADHGMWLDNGKFDTIASTVSVSSARKLRWELEKAQRRGKLKGMFFGWWSFFID